METITITKPKNEEAFIDDVLKLNVDSLSQVSDGYHTIAELYDHRIELYIALCRLLASKFKLQIDGKGIWRSKKHSDGTEMEGWFLLGILTVPGQQITYHLPLARWDETSFASTLDKAPEFDGHTSADVLRRLKTL